MTEKEYFLRLEWRIGREMAGMRDPSLRHYWCDGLVPDQFAVSGDKCRITGLAYFGESGQELWSFVVLLGSETTVREKVDWKSLLPGENMTGWLALDFEKKLIKVNPFRARADDEGASHAEPDQGH